MTTTLRRLQLAGDDVTSWFTNVFAGLLVAIIAAILLVGWLLHDREKRDEMRPEGGAGGGWSSEHERFGDATHPSWSDEFRYDRLSSTERGFVPGPTYERQEAVAEFSRNERVTATSNIGGAVTRVPSGTVGTVVSHRSGLFTDYVTVEFDNGYTEEVRERDVQRTRTWF